MLCIIFLARYTYSMHTIIKVSKEMKINVRHTTPLLPPYLFRVYIADNISLRIILLDGASAASSYLKSRTFLSFPGSAFHNSILRFTTQRSRKCTSGGVYLGHVRRPRSDKRGGPRPEGTSVRPVSLGYRRILLRTLILSGYQHAAPR